MRLRAPPVHLQLRLGMSSVERIPPAVQHLQDSGSVKKPGISCRNPFSRPRSSAQSIMSPTLPFGAVVIRHTVRTNQRKTHEKSFNLPLFAHEHTGGKNETSSSHSAVRTLSIFVRLICNNDFVDQISTYLYATVSRSALVQATTDADAIQTYTVAHEHVYTYNMVSIYTTS